MSGGGAQRKAGRGRETGNVQRRDGGVSVTPPSPRGWQSKKLKNLRGAIENDTPPPQKKIVFGLRSASQNRYIAQTLRLSKKLLIFTL